MPAGEALEDDYIVSLLKNDADEHKKRCSTIGNGPLLSTAKRRPDAPKPNTRFLKNIIRETDSHNAALKAKEEAESRARLRELKRGDEKGKRKREGEEGGEKDGKRRKEREGRWASALGLGAVKEARGMRQTKGERQGRRAKDETRERESERSTHKHRHRRERADEEGAERRHRKHHRPERNGSRDRSRSPHHRKERRRRHRSNSRSPARSPANEVSHANTIDDLDDFLGPLPAGSQTLPRGRGAFKPSGMDDRFSKDYNPSTDVALDHEEEDDWDMALEALKARTKWRAQGAERLRAAGFTEEEIERWEKGKEGKEKDVEDVKWRKRGEGREWDRGKVLTEDGEGVDLKAEWAR